MLFIVIKKIVGDKNLQKSTRKRVIQGIKNKETKRSKESRS